MHNFFGSEARYNFSGMLNNIGQQTFNYNDGTDR